jgi:hypothetical protein
VSASRAPARAGAHGASGAGARSERAGADRRRRSRGTGSRGAGRARRVWPVLALAVVVGAVGAGLWSIRVSRLVILGGTRGERSELASLLRPLVVGGHPFWLDLGTLEARLRQDATLVTELRLVSLSRVGLGEEVLTVAPRRPAAMLAGGLVVYRNGLVLPGGVDGAITVCPVASPMPVASCASPLTPRTRLPAPVVATAAALARAGVGAVVSETTGGGVAVRLRNGAGCLLGRARRAAAELAACRAFAGAGELVDVTNPNAPAGLGQLRVG